MEIVPDINYDTHAQIVQTKEEHFGITDSAEFITTISKTLYANGTLAMVREVICNAWDAHIAANKTDVPLEIVVTKNFFSVQDFGAGIHKDDIHSIYCVYGNSTKNKDNSQTGGFGLGTKAPFAYSDYFTLVSCHKGIKQVSRIVRSSEDNPGKPSRSVIVEVPTEDTGITVQVPISATDKWLITRYVEGVCKFGGIKANLKNDDTVDSEIIALDSLALEKSATAGNITIFTDPYADYVKSGDKIVIRYGTVIYPIPKSLTNFPELTYLKRVLRNSEILVVLEAEPGTLVVQPSREHLAESPSNIAILKKLFKDFYDQASYDTLSDELKEKLYKNLTKDGTISGSPMYVIRSTLTKRYAGDTCDLYYEPKNEAEKVQILVFRCVIAENAYRVFYDTDSTILKDLFDDVVNRFWKEKSNDVSNILLNRANSEYRIKSRFAKYLKKLFTKLKKASIDPKKLGVSRNSVLYNTPRVKVNDAINPLFIIPAVNFKDNPYAMKLSSKRIVLSRTQTGYSEYDSRYNYWSLRIRKNQIETAKKLLEEEGFTVYLANDFEPVKRKTEHVHSSNGKKEKTYHYVSLERFYPDDRALRDTRLSHGRGWHKTKPKYYLDVSFDKTFLPPRYELFKNMVPNIKEVAIVCTKTDRNFAKKHNLFFLNGALRKAILWQLKHSRNFQIAVAISNYIKANASIVKAFENPEVQEKYNAESFTPSQKFLYAVLKDIPELLNISKDGMKYIDYRQEFIKIRDDSLLQVNDLIPKYPNHVFDSLSNLYYSRSNTYHEIKKQDPIQYLVESMLLEKL